MSTLRVMGWTVCPLKSHVEALTLRVGKQPCLETGPLKRQGGSTRLMWERTHPSAVLTRGDSHPQREVRDAQVQRQQERPQGKPSLPTPPPGASSLQNCEKLSVLAGLGGWGCAGVHLRHSVCPGVVCWAVGGVQRGRSRGESEG